MLKPNLRTQGVQNRIMGSCACLHCHSFIHSFIHSFTLSLSVSHTTVFPSLSFSPSVPSSFSLSSSFFCSFFHLPSLPNHLFVSLPHPLLVRNSVLFWWSSSSAPRGSSSAADARSVPRDWERQSSRRKTHARAGAERQPGSTGSPDTPDDEAFRNTHTHTNAHSLTHTHMHTHKHTLMHTHLPTH